MVRLNFNKNDYETIKKFIKLFGGNEEDFITDEIVELGDNHEYIDQVVSTISKNGIEYVLLTL